MIFLSLREKILHELFPTDTSIAIRVHHSKKVLDLCLVPALQHLPQFLHLNEASVVDVEVIKGLVERLPQVKLAPIVHGDDEFIEIYLSRVVDVDGIGDCLHLFGGVMPFPIFLEDSDEFLPRNDPVRIRVDAVEHLRQSLPLLLGDPPQSKVALDDGDEVVSALNKEEIT